MAPIKDIEVKITADTKSLLQALKNIYLGWITTGVKGLKTNGCSLYEILELVKSAYNEDEE